tara:strand:+ start:2415 stop:3074 length:660 start_codon:yes stop_codon:yes gene_type:complete
MARTKATCRRPLPSKEFLPPRLALLEAARAVPSTSSAAAPTSSLTQEPVPTFNAPAAVAAQEPAPPFTSEEMRSFLAQTEAMSTPDAAPISAEQAVAFSRGFRRFLNTITDTLVHHPPLRTHAERQELKKKRIEAKEKMQEATTFYESASEALRQHKILVQEAENFVNERREALDDAECDHKVKRARLDVVQCELELAKSDLKDAKNAYETIKAQEERQ